MVSTLLKLSFFLSDLNTYRRLRSGSRCTYQTVPRRQQAEPAGGYEDRERPARSLGSHGAWTGFGVAVDDGSQIDLADAAVTIKHPHVCLTSSSSSHFIRRPQSFTPQ